jgi:hypothetical protein
MMQERAARGQLGRGAREAQVAALAARVGELGRSLPAASPPTPFVKPGHQAKPRKGARKRRGRHSVAAA